MSGIQLGLAENVSLCCDMGLVGKYPKYVPKYSKYVIYFGISISLSCRWENPRAQIFFFVGRVGGITRRIFGGVGISRGQSYGVGSVRSLEETCHETASCAEVGVGATQCSVGCKSIHQ
jgi:hypothetical protein